MTVRLELGTLGIIDGAMKRTLESYVDSRMFRQRKTYEEYYIDGTNVEAEINLNDLMILAEHFTVLVTEDCAILCD